MINDIMCIYIYVDIYWLHYITLHYTTLYYCKLSCIILCCWALWFPTRPDPPKGTSISRRFSPAMATVSESPPRVLPSSSVSTRRRTWKWLSSFWDHSLQLYRLHQVAHLSWMTGRGIHLWWRNPSIWRSFEGYMIYYIYIYIPVQWFFLQISMTWSMSLFARNRSVTPWARTAKGCGNDQTEMEVSESMGKKERRK